MSWYKVANTKQLAKMLQEKIIKLIDNVDLKKASELALFSEKHCTLKVKIGQIGAFEVYIVNGDWIKTHLEMEFVEGGNDMAYNATTDFKNIIPEHEIWLSAEIRPELLPYILYHEILEAEIIKHIHSDYPKAHNVANFYERKAREQKIFG